MKRKGSSLILAVLLLGFFTAMSMNIYYISQKKAENAGDKKGGEQRTNEIDIASSIIYQEAYLAENFVRKGVVYDPDHPASLGDTDDYTEPDEDEIYLDYDSDSGEWTYSYTYCGIQLNDISEYFDSNWDYTKDDSTSQNIIISEEVEDGEVKSRIWQTGEVPSKITKLWDDSDLLSIGGYKLVSKTDDGTERTAVFEKTVKIVGNDDDISSMTFLITATETVNVSTNSDDDEEYSGAEMSLAIEKTD